MHSMRSMTVERFRELAETYGGDLARWPTEDRAAARRLLETSLPARVALAEARRLDTLLAEDLQPMTAPVGLVDRIVGQAVEAPAPRPHRATPVREGIYARWRNVFRDFARPAPAVAMAACLAAGIAIGVKDFRANAAQTFRLDIGSFLFILY